MAYSREPDSLEDALTIIAAALGVATMASVCLVSDSLVQKWCNPAHSARPNFNQMAALDRAMMAANGLAPIHRAFARQIGWEERAEARTARAVVGGALRANKALGELNALVADAISPEGEAGEELSANERMKIQRAAKVGEETLLDLQASLRSPVH